MTAGMLRFNPAARKVLAIAHEEALRLGHAKIGPGHLLLGFLQDEDLIAGVFQGQSHNLEEVRRIVASKTPDSEKAGVHPGKVDLSVATQRVLEQAIDISRRQQHRTIGSEHLFYALIRQEDRLTMEILAATGLDQAKIQEAANQRLASYQSPSELDELLNTIAACRRLFETKGDTPHIERLRQIEAIVRDYFRH